MSRGWRWTSGGRWLGGIARWWRHRLSREWPTRGWEGLERQSDEEDLVELDEQVIERKTERAA
jgi:hypothetical protein